MVAPWAVLATGLLLGAGCGPSAEGPGPEPQTDDRGLPGLPDVATARPEGRLVWVSAFGGSSSDRGTAVVAAPDGSVFLAGHFTGLTDFGGSSIAPQGGPDGFVVKLSPSGTTMWVRTFGGAGPDFVRGAACDRAGNLIAVGSFQGSIRFGSEVSISQGGADAFAVKFAPDGRTVWARTFGGPEDDQAFAVATDPSGSVLVTGHMMSTVDFGGGPLTSAGSWDLFVVKLASDGSHAWSRRFGGANSDDDGFAIAADPGTSDVLVTGRVYDPVNFGGGLFGNSGKDQAFLLRLSESGAYRWAHRLGPDGAYSLGQGVAVAPGGDVVHTGEFQGSIETGGAPLNSPTYISTFVTRYNPSGEPLWSRAFVGSDTNGAGGGVAIDAADNVIIGGSFRGAVDFGGGGMLSLGDYDGYVAKLAPDGSHLWSRRLGGAQSDSVWRVAFDPSGSILASGGFAGTVDFGGRSLSASSSVEDAFALKLTY
jgi:hypothetical protein